MIVIATVAVILLLASLSVAQSTDTPSATNTTACTDQACCTQLETSSQRPCTTCTTAAGCVYYGLVNNNVFVAGGKCLLAGAEAPGAYKKIENKTECVDLCSNMACDSCLNTNGCIWCDAGSAGITKVGINVANGACELGKCTGATPLTKCPVPAESTTTAAVSTAETNRCTVDSCCKQIETGKQPCTTCTSTAGCTFYGLFNNDVFQAGGKCVLSTATETPTGHKKIEKVTQCADLCADVACDKCLGITGCVWCDTGKAIGDKVGINTSTGSCSLAKCTSGVDPLTTCPSSAATGALTAMAAIVAIVATAL
jgi:hypothetical protein